MLNNPASRQQWILDLLKSEPTMSYVEGLPRFRQKWAKSKTTFDKDWKKAQERFNEYQDAINKAKLEEAIKIEKESVRSGLKTKIDRQLILQKLIQDSIDELNLGKVNDFKKTGAKVQTFERYMTVIEKTSLRKTIKELQSEISKMEGDYAPEKVQHGIDPDSKEVVQEVFKIGDKEIVFGNVRKED